ncbi:MAG TPA: hypothetical protein VNI52_14495 [Sphingobacteriaceae bacterium]|nr:hypothetical protein [Sphingobacteriaceae bacterium]
MGAFNKLPNYTRLDYTLDINSGWYVLTDVSRSNFEHLPNELKIDPSKQPFLIQQGATECIKGRQKHYSKFFTGLRKTDYQDIYTGDNIQDKPSIIIFHLRQERTRLRVYYINGFKVYPKHQRAFIGDFKKSIIDLSQWEQPIKKG